MSNSGTGKAEAGGSQRFVWLGLGVALLLVANGRWILPLATWLFPVGWLVFLERSRRLSGLAVAFVAYVLVYFVIWRPIIPAPVPLYYLIAALYAAVNFLPFVAHRLLAGRPGRFHSTLVFPLTWVAAEFVFSRWITPYGSWTSLAYTQTDFLSLLQLASVTGIAGVTFMVVWFGSVMVWLLGTDRDNQARLRGAAVYAAVLLAVITLGQVSIARAKSGTPVRTASLVATPELLSSLERSLAPVRRGEAISDAVMNGVREAALRLNDDLLERTVREATAGARLVAWSETAGRVIASEEQEFIDRVGQLAVHHGVVLILGLGVWHPGETPPFENKIIAIDAAGDFLWEFNKAYPIIGAESPFITAGDGLVTSAALDIGRVGTVICHDLDFPHFIRQTSRDRIGLLVAPSADWPSIADLHARMAVPRAVENGTTLLRPTSGGRSLAVDARGRITSQSDFAEDVMVAYVSPEASRTIYGIVGDLFSWLCVVGLAALMAAALKREANA